MAAARAITVVDQWDHTMAEVAAALAVVGKHEQAEAAAHSIADPYQRGRALAQVAAALAAVVKLATAACAIGRWTVVIGPVLAFDPSAFTRFTSTPDNSEGARLRGLPAGRCHVTDIRLCQVVAGSGSARIRATALASPSM